MPSAGASVDRPQHQPWRQRLGASPRSQFVWALIAVSLAVAGVVGSLLGARVVASGHAAQARRALGATAQQVADSVGVSLQREGDLVRGTSALIAQDPNLSQMELRRWLHANDAHRTYPELGAVAFVTIVPQARLQAFERGVSSAIRPAGPGRNLVVPFGRRAFYCLTTVGVGWGPLAARPQAWTDLCGIAATRAVLLGARDTGATYDLAMPYYGQTVLGEETPVYRGGAVPTTIAARRRAFVGWLGETIIPSVMLGRALRTHPGVALRISFRKDGYVATFTAGRVPAHADQLGIALAPYWTAEVSGPAASASVFGYDDALGVLLGGSAFSILLAALLYVLASGRARARRLVHQKTGELAYLAMHDALTGLPNRVLALDRAEQLLLRARRTGDPVAALYIDIDGFKQINDSFGHGAGDALLQEVARRLRSVVRASDTAARLGGDEFLVLLDCRSLDVAPELVAERMLEVLREPYDLDGRAGRPVVLTASIGLAYGTTETADQLIGGADIALYAAKTAGRNRCAPFQPEMQTASQDRLTLQLDLSDALAGQQLRLVYQPILDLSDNRIIAVEALLRWTHPKRGVIPPDTFIPLAEQNGQILPIGRWVLREACQQAAAWRSEGCAVTVAVNVSGHQLDHDSLISDVLDALAEAGLEPSGLMLEITETSLMKDPEAAAERLSAIRALGVQIAIDDFGTGYSSLAYLRNLPVDALKIDRSFVQALANEQSTALIHTLIQLGKTLDIKTIAEGIEDRAQLDQLEAECCDHGQGFLFARPLEPEQLVELLRQRAARTVPSTE